MSKIQGSRFSPSKGGDDLEENDGDKENDPLTDENIQLPPDTLYLIDKVVRQRAKQGPIGIDNSELINLEVEEEYKEKNQYLLNLASGKGSSQVNQQPHETDMSEDTKQYVHNEKLFQRLTAVAY